MKAIKFFGIVFFSISLQNLVSQNLTQYINPFIGTGGHGHTFPGATYPFAMVQLSPDTRIDGSWDGCSGYHYSDSIIYGFSHTHLSGTGCSDYGDIAYMPYFSLKDDFLPHEILYNQGVSFSHQNEKAKAGYYSVKLNNEIQVELTSTRRCGIQKYTMTNDGYLLILLNLKHRDKLLEGKINEVDAITFSGKRVSKAWAAYQELYFYSQCSKLPQKSEIIPGPSGDEYLKMKFKVTKGEVILIKTGISPVDEKGAQNNLEKEMSKFDFEAFRINANGMWNFEMSKIKVYGGTETEKTNFYTALYHCMIHPSIANDIDNRYRGRDGKIHNTDKQGDYFTVFSLWDTYRAVHPLLAIIDGFRTADFISTFIRHDEQAGRLPVWELWGNETNCMIGYHAVSVIFDAFHKGVRNYDIGKIYRAMKRIANENTPALNSYKKYGYVRAEDDAESVSKTLEYAYNDWCIGKMALELGDLPTTDSFAKRASNWMNVYDSSTGYMRPRLNGSLMEPFSPYMVDNNFTEANSYQYSFYVPHDLKKFKKICGGNEAFDKKLDELFSAKPQTEGRNQADITGLIGQYAHGNEPSHHIAFLYSDMKKRNKMVKYIRDSFYKNSPNGLIGNEDCGQMSAWYVWAAMGMYPICPGSKEMALCEPIFDSIQILSDIYTITKRKGDNAQLYNIDDYYEGSKGLYGINTQPYIVSSKKAFKDKQFIQIKGLPNIYYSMNSGQFQLYSDSLKIDKSCHLKFYGTDKSYTSAVQEAFFHKLQGDRKIKLLSKHHPQYHAGGPDGLIDGIEGDLNWKKGDWQGYQGQDFEAIIEFNEAKHIQEIAMTFLEDQGSWIYFPKEVKIYASADGVKFLEIRSKVLTPSKIDAPNSLQKVIAPLGIKAKYIKVWAKSYGKLPITHLGAGGDSYIFIDEIEVK